MQKLTVGPDQSTMCKSNLYSHVAGLFPVAALVCEPPARSRLSFEGSQVQGRDAILAKLTVGP